MASKGINADKVLEMFRQLPTSSRVSVLTALGTSSTLLWAGNTAKGMWKVYQEVSNHRWFWEDHVVSGLAKLNTLGMLPNPEPYAPSLEMFNAGSQRYQHRSDWYSNKAIFPETRQTLKRPSKIKGAPPLVYVALGDSAAQGVGCKDVRDSYVALFASYLRRATRRRVILLNLSISGAISSTVINSELPQLLASGLKPDIMTLDIGGNDTFAAEGLSVEDFAKNLKIITQNLPSPTLICEVPGMKPLPADKRSFELNEALKAAIVDSPHTLVPVRHLSEVPIWRTLAIRAEDGFHPNHETYRLIAQEFVRSAEPFLQDRGWWDPQTADIIPPENPETVAENENRLGRLLRLRKTDSRKNVLQPKPNPQVNAINKASREDL